MNDTRNLKYNKNITMNEIAIEAGVSVATVSRYINKQKVSEKRAKKVEEAIKKFNFKPNLAAKGLKTSKSNQIMLVVPDITNPYYSNMYNVVQELSSKKGYVAILYNTNESIENEKKAIDLIYQLNCDGVIFCSTTDNKEIIDRLTNLDKPVVSSSSFESGVFDTVHGRISGYGVYIGTNYLINKGHRLIGYAGGPTDSIYNKRRYSGFIRSLNEHNIKFDEKYNHSSLFSIDGGRETAKYFMSLDKMPSAIACANDMIAIGIIYFFTEHGIKVPEDVSIVGMDNINLSELIKPALTTVTNDSGEFAEKAIKLLFDRIDGTYSGSSREEICSRVLIERQTVRGT